MTPPGMRGAVLALVAALASEPSWAGATGSFSGVVGPDQFNRIDVYSAGGTFVLSALPSQPAYQVAGLPPGNYYVLATSPFSDRISELYPNIPCPLLACVQDLSAGSLVSVTSGQNTANVDFELARGASLQTRVVTEGAGDLIVEARVRLFDATGSLVAVRDGGESEVKGIFPGTYFVSAEDLSGAHLGELYDNHLCDGCSATDGTPVVLEQAVFQSRILRLVDAHLGFHSLQPCRLVDTRESTPLVLETTRVFSDFSACGVPDTAVALTTNITVVGPTAAGELTVRANGWDLHLAFVDILPVIHFGAGVTRATNAHLSIARGTGGHVASAGFLAFANLPPGETVHLVVDATGYFAPVP